jgi:hypothetical protein
MKMQGKKLDRLSFGSHSSRIDEGELCEGAAAELARALEIGSPCNDSDSEMRAYRILSAQPAEWPTRVVVKAQAARRHGDQDTRDIAEKVHAMSTTETDHACWLSLCELGA